MRLARPYLASGTGRAAWLLLFAILLLTLANVGGGLLLSFSQRLFYTALQEKRADAFLRALFWFTARPERWSVPPFVLLVTVNIAGSCSSLYLQAVLQLRWQRWLTARTLGQWLSDRCYYRLAHLPGSSGGSDNPDQRIQEDIEDATRNVIAFATGLLSSITWIVSFIGLLYALSGPLTIAGLHVGGYLPWTALLYAAACTLLAHLAGRSITKIESFGNAVAVTSACRSCACAKTPRKSPLCAARRPRVLPSARASRATTARRSVSSCARPAWPSCPTCRANSRSSSPPPSPRPAFSQAGSRWARSIRLGSAFSLRDALRYPSDPRPFCDAELALASAVGIAELAMSLDLVDDWSRRLSPGQQQRLALARAILRRPSWLFLDEPTASLHPSARAELHHALLSTHPSTTLVTVTHDPAVAALHDRRIDFSTLIAA